MKTRKILTVVLTFSLSLAMILNYTNYIKKIRIASKSSYVINLDNEINIENIEEVKTAILAKDNKKQITSASITSRSGKHTPLTIAPKVNKSDNSSSEENNTSEKSLKENESETEPVEPKPTYEGIELEYNAVYNVSSSRLTKSKGVTYYNGHKETYYSQKVLSGKGLKMLNNNGRHVANDGTIRDGDGYIAVACNYLPKGSTIMTSLGPGKVYDTGGMTGKWIDIYVNW